MVPEEYRKRTIERLDKTISESRICLNGLVLDLFSGDISIAPIIGKNRTICYEFSEKSIETLREEGICCVRGNIMDGPLPGLPFKDNTFDYLFCCGLPMRPYANSENPKPATLLISKENYIAGLTKEIIRITRNKALVNSIPFIENFPREYAHRILDRRDGYTTILNCQD